MVVMAELDLQKQMAEAAAERGGIAAALLAIQKLLDKMEPTVTRMEPVLASLEPTVVDLAAWRPGVDQAVGRLQADLGEIRAELAKVTASPFFHEAGKATSGGIPTTAGVPSLTNNTGGDGHGPYGHSRTPPAWVLVVGGSLLPSPAPANDELARKRRQLIVRGAGLVAGLYAYKMLMFRRARQQTPRITVGSMADRAISRESNLRYIYHSSDINCSNQLRMRKARFFRLCAIFRERNLLLDSIHTSIEEQVAMFKRILKTNPDLL